MSHSTQFLSLKAELEKFKRVHSDLYEVFVQNRKALTAQTLEDCADIVCMLRDIEKLADDVRKESKLLYESAQRAACMLWAVQNEGGPIRASLCTASPQIKQMATTPNRERDPENYKKLMAFLGCPENRIEDGVLIPHWPKLMEFLSARISDGLPMPEGIDVTKTYDIYSLLIRKNKE